MTSIDVSAYAKVNLFLKVLNRRKDSYHNILTVFERISLCDNIRLTAIPEGIEVTTDLPITKRPEDNLVFKAARLIFKNAGLTKGVRIEVEKKIPIAAGLGGGSSDAAAVLVGLNRLYRFGFSLAELMKMGASLGADIPFFIMDTPYALGMGIGDRLKKVFSRKRFWHLIVNPGFPLSTKDVYGAWKEPAKRDDRPSEKPLLKYLTSTTRDVTIRSHLSMDFGAADAMLHNDLQSIAVSLKGSIGRVIERLASSMGKKVYMSGSGPSVFSLYGSEREAMHAKSSLLRGASAYERSTWSIFVASTR